MRNIIIATAFLVGLSTAAMSETSFGPSISLNTDVKAEYKVDAETTALTINPELMWSGIPKTELTLGTTLNLWENIGTTSNVFDEMEHMPTLEFGATYMLTSAWDIEGLMNYDLEEGERSEITISSTWSF